MAVPRKLKNDTLLSVGVGAHLDPHVSASGTGGFIVGHHSPGGALATFDIVGGVGVRTFGISTINSLAAEAEAAVAGTGDGSFMAVWRETPNSSGDSNVLAQFRSSRSSSEASEVFLVNLDNTTATQGRPEVTELADGSFAFAWIDLNANAVKAAVFDKFGRFTSFSVETVGTAATQDAAAFDLGLTALSNGFFVVSWRDNSSTPKFRILTNRGDAIPEELSVGPMNAGATDVVELADGRILIVYENGGVWGRIFEGDGSAPGAEFRISQDGGLDTGVAATALHDGRFMVVAQDESGHVAGRIMNPDGTPDTDEFPIDASTGAALRPSIATLADGRVAVSWEDYRGSAAQIFYAIFDPRETGAEVAGTAYADEFVGSAFADNFVLGSGDDKVAAGGGNDQLFGGLGNDTLLGEADNDIIDGGGGNDTLNGGAGNDTMDGRGGNDLYSVDNASDIVTEAQGAGTDQVNASVSYTLAPGQEIETLSTSNTPGTTAINLTGNERANTLIGNAGANVLNGGAGNDTMDGRGDNDLYYVDSANDVVKEAIGGGNDRVHASASYTLAGGPGNRNALDQQYSWHRRRSTFPATGSPIP